MSRAAAPGMGLIALLGVLSAFSPLSIDLYLPSMPTIARALGAPSAAVQQTLSVFFLGLGIGQLIYGPLSDRFGRRPVLYLGIGIYLAASIACALATNIHVLLAARAVQGLGAAASPVAARAIIRDVYDGRQAARALSFVMMVMAVAPLLAPLAGGQILALLGWRAIFWTLTVFAVISLGLVTFRLSETHSPERRGEAPLGARFRAYGTLLKNPRARAYLACGGLVFAALFAYVTGAPFVYIRVFGVAPEHFGFYFAANVLGLVVGNYLNSRLVVRLGYRRLLGYGTVVALASSLVLLGFALSGRGGLAGIAIPLFFTVSTVGVVAANTVAGLLELFPRNAGAASALFGVFQFGLGSAAAAAVGALNNGTPVAMGAVMTLSTIGAFIAYRRLKRLEQSTQPEAGR